MHITVYLPNWIGDAVMATPSLRTLRKHFPDARITGVVRPYVAPVLDGGDWFDHVVHTERGTWGKGILATAYRLRSPKPDIAILQPNSFRPALIATLAGTRRIVGYDRYGRNWLGIDRLQPLREADGRLKISPAVDAYNRLVQHVGCPDPGSDLELFTTPADEAAADAAWKAAGLDAFPEVVCLNSGAAFGAAKHWPVEHFADLAGRLFDRRDCAVLVLCGPGDRQQASEIAKLSARPGVFALGDLQTRGGPSLSIGLTKACVRRADLLVTTDSGPRHFAHAFDRPVVTLFGPTHIAWTETNHPRSTHMQRKLECGPCQQRVCPLGHHRCMKELSPKDVFAAAESLLQGCP